MIAQLDDQYIRMRPKKVWDRLLAYFFFEGRPLTTRGRWFNFFTFSVLRLIAGLPWVPADKAPVFIIGIGRSGSTILGKVLSMHESLGFLNEPKALWSMVDPADDLVGSYSAVAPRYLMSDADVDRKKRLSAKRLHGAFRFFVGAERVVDKYPEMLFRVEYLKEIFPKSKFLLLSRECAPNARSIANWSQRLGSMDVDGSIDWWGLNDRKWNCMLEQIIPHHADLKNHVSELRQLSHEGRGVVEWIVTTRAGLQLLVTHKDDVLHIPYELLCYEPDYWCDRMQLFLGVPNDPVFKSYAAAKLAHSPHADVLHIPHWLEQIRLVVESELKSAVATAKTTL